MSNLQTGVYIHSKPDGTPFYVGKGNRYRMGEFYGRSDWHQKTVKKYGKLNIIKNHIECSSDEIAYELERGLIKTLRANGYTLCNLTDGGEGVKGYKPSPETIERVRKQNAGRVQSTEERLMRSEALKGKSKPPRTQAHKELIGSKIKGRKWYNNGKNVCFVYEGQQPEGYVLGRGDRSMISETQEKKLCQK